MSFELYDMDEVSPAQQEQAKRLLVEGVGMYLLDGRASEVRVVALSGSTVAGAALGRCFEAGGLAAMTAAVRQRWDELPPVDELLLESLEVLERPDARIGNLFALAVAPEFRGRGIGRRLVAARRDWFFAAGATAVATEAWARTDGVPTSIPLFRSVGYVELATIPRYWFDSSAPPSPPGTSRDCPICGAPCNCTAVIFMDPRLPA